MHIDTLFNLVAKRASRAAGTPWVFCLALAVVAAWALSGPVFGFNDTWQLAIYTGTTIVTFLMVFLMQNTQNRDTTALHAKLDELIRASEAENKFIGIEHLSTEELERIRDECEEAVKRRQ